MVNYFAGLWLIVGDSNSIRNNVDKKGGFG